MRSKNNSVWLLTVLQMHLVDEEWNLPRRENDRNDLTNFSYRQNGRSHSARRHVQGTPLKISPSDANFMLQSGVVTHCSRVVYMNTYVSEKYNASIYEISYPKKTEVTKGFFLRSCYRAESGWNILPLLGSGHLKPA